MLISIHMHSINLVCMLSDVPAWQYWSVFNSPWTPSSCIYTYIYDGDDNADGPVIMYDIKLPGIARAAVTSSVFIVHPLTQVPAWSLFSLLRDGLSTRLVTLVDFHCPIFALSRGRLFLLDILFVLKLLFWRPPHCISPPRRAWTLNSKLWPSRVNVKPLWSSGSGYTNEPNRWFNGVARNNVHVHCQLSSNCSYLQLCACVCPLLNTALSYCKDVQRVNQQLL